MSLTRVQNVFYNQKRIVSGKNNFFAKVLGTVLLFLFLLPYVITSLWGNANYSALKGSVNRTFFTWEKELSTSNIYIENISAIGNERIPLEIYLVDKLARSINTDYHPEALKAQAVLLRTALVAELRETNRINHGMETRPIGTLRIAEPEYGRGLWNEDIIMAVVSTKGVILTYDNNPAKVAYFAVSNGRTRDGSEALGQDGLSYFKAVECNRDFMAENFASQKTMSKNDFINAVENAAPVKLPDDFTLSDLLVNRDLSGYIIDITFDTGSLPLVLSGEECRNIWGLSSSSFTIEESGNRVSFSVRGIGHGLGLSQFAANEMAKSDKDYISILAYFFPGTLLTKFE